MPESPGYLGHLGNITQRVSDAIDLQYHQEKHPDYALDRTYHVKANLPSRFGIETEETDEEWGEERLIRAAESVRGSRAEQVLSAIFTAAHDFVGNAPQHDDMTLVLKVDGVESGAATDPACSRTDPG
jgi:Stage II sporulation protein E (SpoIIE)